MGSTEKGQAVIGRQQSPGMRAAKFIFHSGVAAYMISAYRALSVITERVVTEEFLTIWGKEGRNGEQLDVRPPSADSSFLMATATMILSAICDVFPDNWLARASKRVLALGAMPIELTISAIYWPLILFAPSLIVPPADPLADVTKIDAGAELFFIPLWMDLGLHLVPAVALLLGEFASNTTPHFGETSRGKRHRCGVLRATRARRPVNQQLHDGCSQLTPDFFLLEKKYTPPTSTRGAFLTALGVATAYATWVERCAALNGKFPYPFLTVASFEDRCKIYVGAGVFALLVFWGLNALHK
ncbi:hypothetical protein A1Q1_05039 [Trichosporon asahii var. asahii CBS 2479]|uniref:Uncharacterized protein n=1 Tax=Trichosporon asahii var. asahii (strain ATCC 90039 / CBS 2479 / JCM 2466 / KCTC 7840 / NBRC 103889/ NCYC 2677 / UAMH 7654) TaxID=1186058 RepID=J6EUC8_TRIAS|nr:hypothetical protein A1Q1_05039 [Trichosporon asahii var. asahii CBS 2479]EJT46392.1 hypothetical protein A1Q1_05039 [Trichosporon asahii var. asahii CBS 2479]